MVSAPDVGVGGDRRQTETLNRAWVLARGWSRMGARWVKRRRQACRRRDELPKMKWTLAPAGLRPGSSFDSPYRRGSALNRACEGTHDVAAKP